jgi:hypothetical protein
MCGVDVVASVAEEHLHRERLGSSTVVAVPRATAARAGCWIAARIGRFRRCAAPGLPANRAIEESPRISPAWGKRSHHILPLLRRL